MQLSLWRSLNLRAPLRFLSMAAAVRALALLLVLLGAGDSGPARHRAGTADLPRAFISCRAAISENCPTCHLPDCSYAPKMQL